MRVFTPSPNSVPSGSTMPARPPGLSSFMMQHEKQVGRLAGAELGGEVGLDAVLLHAAERRVGDDDVDALLRPQSRSGRASVLSWRTLRGHVDAVQQHVGHAQHVRQVLLLDAGEASWIARSSSAVFACLRRCSMAQVRKPPVPQAGSRIVSPSRGLTCSTMNWVTARGV